ncbi:CopG family transcriptional regulator [Nitrospirillum amazonense]|nr:CopG family transcriptional regulator [Nitrospirillum amazonense]
MKSAATHEMTVTVSMPSDLKAALDAEAIRVQVSPSDLVVEAVRQHLNVAAPPSGGDDRKAAFARLRSFAGTGVAIVGSQSDDEIMRRIREVRED